MGYERVVTIGVLMITFVLIISGLTFYLSVGCPVGTFPCDNGTVCIPQRQVCDKIINCFEGEDEEPVTCGMFHGTTTLVARNFAKSHVANTTSSITDIGKSDCDNGYLKPCCHCTHSESRVFCVGCGLGRIPKLHHGVTLLFLVEDNLQLRKESLQGLNPIYLNLKKNNISHVPAGIFSGLHSLEKLFLSYNRIHKLPLGIFKGLDSLQWLFLEMNNIHKFPLVILKDVPSLQWLNLSQNQLTLKEDIFPRCDNLIELILDYNLIEVIDEKLFSQLEYLERLSLQYNNISFIEEKGFSALNQLRELRLSGNPLNKISDKTFSSMSHLDSLFVDYTRLTVDEKMLTHANLSYLNLRGIGYSNIDFNVLHQLKSLKYVVYEQFSFCSMTPYVIKCEPKTDGVSTVRDLLSKPVLRYSAWLMAGITFLGNALVLWGRFIYRDENRTVTMVIRNLAISDILMGFYLLIIGIQDARFRNRYHEFTLNWITSWSCAATGILAVTSSEVSMLILAFMSLERFLLIADPFGGHRRLNARNVCTCLMSIWIVGSLIAVAPVIVWRTSTRFYGFSSGTCYPLHIQEKYPLGWEYSTFLFLGLNFFLLTMIAILYSSLMVSIWRTRRATPLAMLDCEFAVRFFFIVLTHVFSWAPIIFVKLYAFMSHQISEDTYAWLVIFMLPLNSAVNPLLYTFTTPKYRHQVLLRGWHKFTSRRKTEGSAVSNPDESLGKVIPLLYHNQNSASATNCKI